MLRFLVISLQVSLLAVAEVVVVVVAGGERSTIACTVVRVGTVEEESKSSNRLPSLVVECIERVELSVER